MKIRNVNSVPLLLIIVSLLLIAVSYVDTSFLSTEGNEYLASAVLQVLVFAIPSAIYARARGRAFMSHMRFKFFKAVDIPLLVYALGFMIFGGATLSFYMYRLMPNFFNLAGTAATQSITGVGTGIYAVVTVALLPAVTEEFLFRGIVMTEYGRNGVALSVVLTSLTFSLIHFDLARLPVYFVLGFVLCLVTLATRSIFAAMIIHAANNVLAMFFEEYVYRAALKQGGSIVLFAFICTAAALLFAFLFFSALARVYQDLANKNVSSDHTNRKRLSGSYVKDALASPLFLLLIVIDAAGIILNVI